MSEPGSSVRHSIGLSGVIRGLLAVGAIIAIAAGLADGRYGLAVAGVVFFVAAAALGYLARRARQATIAPVAPPRSL
jgi:hypothetical protein